MVRMFSCHLLPIVNRIFFRCFRMSCFICIVLPFVDIALIFLLSPVYFWFISSSCAVIFCVVFCFLFLHIPALFFFKSFWPVFLDIFLHFRSNFPYWFWFFLRAFCEYPNFFKKLISSLHWLVHFIRLLLLLLMDKFYRLATRQGLFYVWRLGNPIHCIFICTDFFRCFSREN